MPAPGDSNLSLATWGDDDGLDQAMADFAVRYADQNERDHAAFLAAIAQGRVRADTGV